MTSKDIVVAFSLYDILMMVSLPQQTKFCTEMHNCGLNDWTVVGVMDL